MARNRKRGRDRQVRRSGDQAALATARDTDSAPDPLTHASGEAELAEAQLALGRPELADVPDDEELTEFEEEDEAAAAGGIAGGGRSSRTGGFGGRGGGAAGTELIGPGDSGGRGGIVAAAHESLPVRLVQFLQGSWRELQRVQWPDRRQVFQATGVVIGFVIVAGIFLGVADLVASKLVNLILK